MKESRLPQELIEVGYKYGFAGRRVYFPKQKLHTLVTSHVPDILREVEATYEERGVTFYEESSPHKVFSGMFSKSKIAFKLNLKLRTAASVSATAWKGWREWFGRKERPRLEQLRTIAQDAGLEYTAFYLSYLEIRNRLRKNQPVTAKDYASYHSVPAETIQAVIDLAQASIESCPWRGS